MEVMRSGSSPGKTDCARALARFRGATQTAIRCETGRLRAPSVKIESFKVVLALTLVWERSLLSAATDPDAVEQPPYATPPLKFIIISNNLLLPR